MRAQSFLAAVLMCVMAVSNTASADTFGSGGNQFSIDFVPISGSTNPTTGIPAGAGFIFTGVANNYRMGTYEVTNDQWAKFKAAYGAVTGSPSSAYDSDPYFTGANVPVGCASWYEAAQFVNYLNTSTSHQAAYKFTGTQGTSNYTLATWASTDTGYNASNPYRNSNAFYFLPTENEWMKAAYWNGTSLQAYATKAGESLTQGDGTSGTGWNYYSTNYAPPGPWAVGSGSQELNGTYDMMGNVWEWMESPYYVNNFATTALRGLRGASFDSHISDNYLASYNRYNDNFSNLPNYEYYSVGFRVASIPEPCTLMLLGLGAAVVTRKQISKSI